MARSMLSAGMLTALAASTAVRSRGLPVRSPPPTRAATVISRMSLVKARPRCASTLAFLCLMLAHLLCPDMTAPPGLRESYHSAEKLAKRKLAVAWDPFSLRLTANTGGRDMPGGDEKRVARATTRGLAAAR